MSANACQSGDGPCATCPWRRQSQTPAAVAASPVDAMGGRWFEVANLRKHWKHIGGGGMMPCHATDHRAHLYGGKPVAERVEQRLCVGLVVLVRREIHAFLSAGGEFERYRKLPGGRMTLAGVAQWAARLNYPGATFETSTVDGPRAFRLPEATIDHADVRVPWVDKTLNAGALPPIKAGKA